MQHYQRQWMGVDGNLIEGVGMVTVCSLTVRCREMFVTILSGSGYCTTSSHETALSVYDDRLGHNLRVAYGGCKQNCKDWN